MFSPKSLCLFKYLKFRDISLKKKTLGKNVEKLIKRYQSSRFTSEYFLDMSKYIFS